jgi:lysophospholipase L1-like esterase
MRSSRSRKGNGTGIVGVIGTILLVTIIMVVIGEWGGGLALRYVREAQPHYHPPNSDEELSKIYDTDNPQHYREVLSEGWRTYDTVYAPLVEYTMTPYNGPWFSITEDGYRSVGHPQDLNAAGPKVFVFGGSTALGMGVANDETIAAYLDQAVHNAGKPNVQVFNFGVVSWYSTQERIQLEKFLTAGIKPDLVVFVDGLNDFGFCEFPDRTAWYERLMATTRARSRQPLGVELAARSNIVQVARYLGGNKDAGSTLWGSSCHSDADVDRIITRLDTNRRIIAATAEKLGFKAVFVTQPVPTYHYDNAKRPVPMSISMLSYQENLTRGYPRMAEMQAEGKLLSANHLWLAELEPEAGNAYADAVHYTPRMNKAIAEAVAKYVGTNGLLP